MLNGEMGKRFQHFIQQNLASGLVISFRPQLFAHMQGRTATEMIPTAKMIPIRNRTDAIINFRNLGLNGVGTLLSTLNSSFIHANTILNRGKYF